MFSIRPGSTTHADGIDERSPSIIAALDMNVAAPTMRERNRMAELGSQDATLRKILDEHIANPSPSDEWPPGNALLRSQTAVTRRRVKCRDTDVILVSYPKVVAKIEYTNDEIDVNEHTTMWCCFPG